MNTMNMKWIERLELRGIEKKNIERFVIHVPKGAEFIGAQHNATILLMLVRDRFGARNPGRSNRIMETRAVLRVRDGMMIAEKESRYIGSHNMWHLFEVIGKKEKKKA